jgi:uncharacterized Zn finger protein
MTLRRIGPDAIVAKVRGDTAREYVVVWDPTGWRCPCDAVGRCSHIIAVQLIVLEPDHRSPDVRLGRGMGSARNDAKTQDRAHPPREKKSPAERSVRPVEVLGRLEQG